ncbi:MAG: hypothetical protein AAFV95_22435 [Bacteroidota bacterium]
MIKTIQQLGFLFLLTLALGCGKDDETTSFESNAQIVGRDAALCACCGNWLIEIEGQTETLQFVALPPDADIELPPDSFPIDVKLNWDFDPNSPCRFVLIEEIERR